MEDETIWPGVTISSRIKFLDGLRGIAILAVVIWHAYGSTYANNLPFGNNYSVPPIRFFWVGVQLFFMISGFVILMTLERCKNFTEFAIRRWLRLFPAMLIASLLIFSFDILTGLGPNAHRTAIDLLPGLIFVSPSLIHFLTRVMIVSLDDPFWSLYVEVCFYVLFGSAYFLFGSKKAIVAIFAIFMISVMSNLLAGYVDKQSIFARIAAAMDWLGFIHFGWFVGGALLYRYFMTNDRRILWLAISVAVLSVLSSEIFKYGLADRIALGSAAALAIGSMLSRRIQIVLATPFFVTLGFISYPLYLIHCNMVVGLTQFISEKNPAMPLATTPLIPIFAVSCVSFVIATLEPELRSVLSNIFSSIARRHRGA